MDVDVSAIQISGIGRYRKVVEDNELLNAYVAGAMDSSGTVTVRITSNKAMNIGYNVTPWVRISRYHEVLINAVDEWGRIHGINGRYREKESDGKTEYVWEVTTRDGVRRFCEAIEPYVLVYDDTVNIMLHEILPRLDEGKHRTKEGLIEVAEWVEQARQAGGVESRTKYTAEYFRDLWADELES